MSVFRFIAAERAYHPVKTLCRVLGVSRSGFHAWARRPPSPRARRSGVVWSGSGSCTRRVAVPTARRRIYRDLRADGVAVGRKRVERLMRQDGLSGSITSVDAVARRSACPACASPTTWSARLPAVGARTRSGSRTSPTYVPGRAGSTWSVVVDLLQPPRCRLGDGRPPPCRARRRRARACTRNDDSPGVASSITPTKARSTSRSPSADAAASRHRAIDRSGRRSAYDNAVCESFFKTLKSDLDRPPLLANKSRAAHRGLRLHRVLLQPAATPLKPRLPLTSRIREDHHPQETSRLTTPCPPNRGNSTTTTRLAAAPDKTDAPSLTDA